RPLEEQGDLVIIGSPNTENRVGVVSVQTVNVDCADAAFRLDAEYGIQTRVGLHCAPHAHMTLGTFPTGSIRFSFGNFNTDDDVDAAIKALKEICLD
ncbi:MAG: aminotransferase class V-fold PLP-dependent enzyme, partial [Clostridiales bacterium]|nr:aminotransferase class V-fold PLP-dependent enzyme [Clostridiales bacterium]